MNKNLWLVPAVMSALFGTLTLYPLLTLGFRGLFGAVVSSAWSIQIFVDLLFAASIALVFAAPRARKLGIDPLRWGVLTITMGSIGLFAYTARILYVQSRSELTPTGA